MIDDYLILKKISDQEITTTSLTPIIWEDSIESRNILVSDVWTAGDPTNIYVPSDVTHIKVNLILAINTPLAISSRFSVLQVRDDSDNLIFNASSFRRADPPYGFLVGISTGWVPVSSGYKIIALAQSPSTGVFVRAQTVDSLPSTIIYVTFKNNILS
jgi:hypothetical protein